jgi:hypothetical protein
LSCPFLPLPAASVAPAAPGCSVVEAFMPLCGIASEENITRCGIGVKDFLPQRVKFLQML